MRPRVTGQIDGLEPVDEQFANSAQGWADAWARYGELAAMNGTASRGEVTLEFCGHGVEPPESCALVARGRWGEWDD
jgi:hypothetical protein